MTVALVVGAVAVGASTIAGRPSPAVGAVAGVVATPAPTRRAVGHRRRGRDRLADARDRRRDRDAGDRHRRPWDLDVAGRRRDGRGPEAAARPGPGVADRLSLAAAARPPDPPVRADALGRAASSTGEHFHDGIDLATFCGDRIVAAHDGVVLAAGRHFDEEIGWIGDLGPYLRRLDAEAPLERRCRSRSSSTTATGTAASTPTSGRSSSRRARR